MGRADQLGSSPPRSVHETTGSKPDPLDEGIGGTSAPPAAADVRVPSPGRVSVSMFPIWRIGRSRLVRSQDGDLSARTPGRHRLPRPLRHRPAAATFPASSPIPGSLARDQAPWCRRESLHAHYGSQRAQSLWRTRGRGRQDHDEPHSHPNSAGGIESRRRCEVQPSNLGPALRRNEAAYADDDGEESDEERGNSHGFSGGRNPHVAPGRWRSRD